MVKVQIHIGNIPLIQQEYSPIQQVQNAINVVEFARSIPVYPTTSKVDVKPIPETNKAKIVRYGNDYTVEVMSNNHDFVSTVWYGCEKHGIDVTVFLNSTETDLEGAFDFFNQAFDLINEYCEPNETDNEPTKN